MTEKQDDQQHSITSTNDTSIPSSIRPMNNDFNYYNRGSNNNPNTMRYGPPLFDPTTGEGGGGGGRPPTMMMGMGGYRRSMAHPQQQQQPVFHPPPAQYQAMQNRAYQQPIILSPSSMGQQSTPLQQPPLPPPPHYLQQQQQLMGDESEFSDELDPFIVDVLKKQQERIFLLKLEKELEAFINNSQLYRLDLPQMNSYQRLLVHKVAPYFKLSHFYEPMRKSVTLCKNPKTAIPETSFAQVVEPETKEQPDSAPKFKIMRRRSQDKSTNGNGPRGRHSPMSSSSSGTATSKEGTSVDRKNMTYEERKAAYEEARARIFKDLEEQQQQQKADSDKDSSSAAEGNPKPYF
ncbi:hypothetical protein O0I10_005070 [Lichtheimia ornata]|uniref:SUZ domain-containing protein n=1 Tax=Lichtheimia ornata TaxID=688661 RepID=A0AAD7V6V0_9FUNG|nr:uncharacterized protein O0I10_005070 [Lichtheimia ornata]KAJ8659355.1 hypothetical protein O0I10_005070 [Lichtheimia ornata]